MLETVFTVLLVLTSLVMILLVLLHKGRGGGLSDMFGGGVSSSLGGSSVAERNLDRFTIGIGVNTGVFTVLNGVLFRSLPAPDAHQLSRHATATQRKRRRVNRPVTARKDNVTTANVAADVRPACTGRAVRTLDTPSSSRACAPRASWAVSCSTTCVASSGVSPRAT